jgi:uncharacterized protein with PIN domain
LRPDVANTQGFIVDKSLPKLGRRLNSKGIDCKIIENEKDSNKIMDIAIKENRIFVTSNFKVFNK